MTTVCATTEKMDDRREQRIHAVLTKFAVWRFTPTGQKVQVGGEERAFQQTRVEWNEEDGKHIIRFRLNDDEPVEQIASELRACGLVVSTQPEAA